MAGPEAVSSGDSLGVRKAPPNSIEAEEALLGSALLSRDASNRLMEVRDHHEERLFSRVLAHEIDGALFQ